MIALSPCEHCGEKLQFTVDDWQLGAVAECPACGRETRVFKPGQKPAKTPLVEESLETLATVF